MSTDRIRKAAAALGRSGGKKKVPKGFAKMDPAKRKAVALAGVKARWGNADEKA